MPDKGYENPNMSGSNWAGPQGDVSKPKVNAGSKSSGYDNTPNSTKARTDGGQVKPAEHKAPKSGYDDISKDGDYGFSGNPKKRSPKV